MLSSLFGIGRTLLGGAEEEGGEGAVKVGEKKLGAEAQQLPIASKKDQKDQKEHTCSASPASTATPASAFGATPGSTSSTPDASGSPDASSPEYSMAGAGVPDYEYPSPLVVRNTFVETPIRSLDNSFKDARDAESSPVSAIGAPPGLDVEAEAADEAAAGHPADTKEAPRLPLLGTSPAPSPKSAGAAALGASPFGASPFGASPLPRPMMWPRTMSADTLEAALMAAAEVGCGATGPAAAVAAAAAAMAAAQPGWPARTLSAETLEAALFAAAEAKVANTPAASPMAAAFEQPHFWPRTMSGDLASMLEASPLGAFGASQPMFWPRTMSGDDLESTLAAAEAAFGAAGCWPPAPLLAPPAGTGLSPSDRAPTALVPPPPPQLPPTLREAELPPPPGAPAQTPDMQVVSLADALPEPELGSEGLPTAGSRGHRLGNCKPCAFLHTKGCKNGKECPFCHLCERGEKKRRQKDKWHVNQHQQQQQVQVQQHVQQLQHQAAQHAAAMALMGSPMAGVVGLGGHPAAAPAHPPAALSIAAAIR